MHAAIAKMVIKTFNANFIKFPTFSKFDKGTRIIKTAQFYTAIKMRNVFMNLCFYESLFSKSTMCKIKIYSGFKNAIF